MVSGATSLVYETVWSRQLHLIFGTSQVAISTVLAAFMAGLALGALFASHWAAHTKYPILWYGVLELFIGGYAVYFPTLLDFFQPVYLEFLTVFEPSPLAFATFQFLLIGLLLLPPTACMGATLPLLVRFVSTRAENVGCQVGRLYGANTLGAVLGTAFAAFLLLPQFGVEKTTYWAATANIVLAFAALIITLVIRQTSMSVAVSPTRIHHHTFESIRYLPVASISPPIAIAALTGFASLLCEVAWFRLTSLVLGGSAYAFSIMLLAFLLGIGIGGWVGGYMADRSFRVGGHGRVFNGLMWFQLQLACFCWIAMYFYNEMPIAYVSLYKYFENSLFLMWPAMVLLPLAVMFFPALLMGLTFPYLVRAMADSGSDISHLVGRIYGVNTIGGIFGAASGGLLFLPWLYMSGAILIAISVNLFAALIAGISSLAVRGRLSQSVLIFTVIATFSGIMLVHWQRPPWDPRLMTAGLYSYVATLSDLSRKGVIDAVKDSTDLIFYEEGLSSVVTVERDREDGNIFLSNNGKVEASLYDMDTQILLAHIPFIFSPSPEQVLVIGLASGITLGSVTLHPAKNIDLVELEPAVVAASHQFDKYNRRPLEDPRVHLEVNDARNFLALAHDNTYDLVSSQPSNPWLTGVSNLFTREFFELGKQKLKPEGVWVQWLQTYSMGPEDVKTLLATFSDVYEEVSVFRVAAADLLVVGSRRDLSLSVDRFGEIFENDAVANDLKLIGIERPEQLLGLHQFSRDTLLSFVEASILNTDDNMRIEYSAPLKLFEDTIGINIDMLEGYAKALPGLVNDVDGLLVLASTYAEHDPRWRRAVEALQYGIDRYPNSQGISIAYEDALKHVREEEQ